MSKSKYIYLRRFRSRPANYVLWADGLDFYVSKRIGKKHESELREHFIGFFMNEEDAWTSAEIRTKNLITTLQGYIKRFRYGKRKKAYERRAK